MVPGNTSGSLGFGVRLNPVSERGGTHIDVAVIAFRFVTETAPGKIHGHLLGYSVSHSSRRGPGPTLIADFARIVEVIQRYEVPRQGVFVRSTAAAKLGQVRVPRSNAGTAEDLIERFVLFDDVNNVFDLLVQELHCGVLIGMSYATGRDRGVTSSRAGRSLMRIRE